MGINHKLLLAIAYVESSWNQYAINVQTNYDLDQLLRSFGLEFRKGKGYRARNTYSIHPRSLNQALSVLPLLRYATTYDLGVMQINKANVEWLLLGGVIRDVVDLFDPCVNVMLGAWILRECVSVHGYSTRALDCYNKGSKRARRWSSYVGKVGQVLSLLMEVRR